MLAVYYGHIAIGGSVVSRHMAGAKDLSDSDVRDMFDRSYGHIGRIVRVGRTRPA